MDQMLQWDMLIFHITLCYLGSYAGKNLITEIILI